MRQRLVFHKLPVLRVKALIPENVHVTEAVIPVLFRTDTGLHCFIIAYNGPDLLVKATFPMPFRIPGNLCNSPWLEFAINRQMELPP
mmetsp:Transcript_42701/g.68973  ORF Transcript_42701/g.68973 Transcript_42701/m.68973 type:complete len:87 (+) Transcript_42701:35-295(+)